MAWRGDKAVTNGRDNEGLPVPSGAGMCWKRLGKVLYEERSTGF